MGHTEITGALVEHIDRLLSEGASHHAIAEQLEVSEYLVGVIAGDTIGRGRRPPPDVSGPRMLNRQRGTDATTIRMIQRMLRTNWIIHRQIAIEAGTSTRIVDMVDAGRRLPVNTERPIVFKDLGERVLKTPTRCGECGAWITIAPCRKCRALRS